MPNQRKRPRAAREESPPPGSPPRLVRRRRTSPALPMSPRFFGSDDALSLPPPARPMLNLDRATGGERPPSKYASLIAKARRRRMMTDEQQDSDSESEHESDVMDPALPRHGYDDGDGSDEPPPPAVMV